DLQAEASAPAAPVVVGPAATVPQPSRRRRAAGRVWLVIASLLGLVVLSVIAALAVTGAGGNLLNAAGSQGIASPGLLLVLFVVVVAVIVGGGLALVAVKGVRAAQAKAERERDEAHARAQLLAAAMDPDTALRLLGYDGNGNGHGRDGRT
ncbi:ATPase, partial [Nonomuraea wenchangensis]